MNGAGRALDGEEYTQHHLHLRLGSGDKVDDFDELPQNVLQLTERAVYEDDTLMDLGVADHCINALLLHLIEAEDAVAREYDHAGYPLGAHEDCYI